ncbi:flagellar hook-associated family protein [Mesorhizobium sp. CAU 1732]|uniref:flagellar hook-associated family protein n=1 Tax=Mesorhizobium sp. CAU 1732 TaxID=3140358 RepID=UPI00326101AC
MKVSFVSSQAISQALRYQTNRLQNDLVIAKKELTTMTVADKGLALGARTGISVSMHREIDRLEGLKDSNQLAASRLSQTQLILQQLNKEASELTATLTTAISGASDPSIAKKAAEGVLSMMSSVLNTNVGGVYLFAGINTDVKPMNDFLDPASSNRQAFEDAFQTHFGFTPNAPQAADIAAADMTDFLQTMVEPQFLGTGWNDVWSSATDQQIVSRITLTETAQTSVSANIPGFRKLAMAASTVAALISSDMSSAASRVVLERAIDLLGEVVNDLANQESATGITETRIDKANDRMSMQIDLFSRSLIDLEGVDEFAASTKVTGLIAQIELSYSLTGRIQQMSLLKYIS